MKKELVIIGAGPAGLSAAVEAARNGVKVTIIDENDRPGGQLFTQTHKFFGSREHRAGMRGFSIGKELLNELEKFDVDVHLNTLVYGIFTGREIACTKGNGSSFNIKAENLLIATGALEKPVIFKGWTRPGVMGAGAAQTMMNVYRVLPGKRVLMVGSGNVGLIVSYQLMQAGAEIVGIIDVLPNIGGYMVHASKVRRMGVPILTSYTIKEAKGDPEVSGAVISRVDDRCNMIPGTDIDLSCDLICLAVGLRPFDELCTLLGLKTEYIRTLGGFIPVHDENMETSMENVYIAGDAAGIEEASCAMEEGKLVGTAVAQRLGYIQDTEAEKKKKEINRRLEHLRLGSFGDDRAEGVRKLIRAKKR